MADDPEDTSTPQTTIAPLKNAGSILAEAVKAISDLAPLYERVRIPGLLVMSGVVLGVLSVVLIIIGQYTPGETRLGEEILVASLAVLFVMLGVAFQTLLNGMQTRIAIETLRIGEERNTMLHEETMAKLKLQSGPPSTPDLPNGSVKPNPYGLSNG